MAEQYPYTPVPKRMEKLLSEIPKLGRPSEASQAWLKGQGYTSGNDMMTLGVMRKLGIVGEKGEPTEFYDAIRNKDGAKVASYVKDAYRELFELYPDAHQKDTEALQSFFRSKTTKGDKVQSLMVRTFQTLSKFGDFSSAAPVATVPKPKEGETTPEEAGSKTTGKALSPGGERAGGLTLNVNLQLQLPASADGDVYDKLFAAMAKHLKGLTSLE